MDEPISHGDNRCPGNIGLEGQNILWNVLQRFTDADQAIVDGVPDFSDLVKNITIQAENPVFSFACK